LSESLVSFYPGAHGLDTTIGDQSIEPKTLEEAVGRELSNTEAKSCFGCHSTGSVADHKLTLNTVTPGLQCQRCHVNADQHLEAISRGKLTSLPPALTHLSAEDTSTFCGQCHRTWQTVVRNRWMGVINVRFQPYRLANSKCFDGVDARMSCTACHNPHRQLITDEKSYDGKCLACHDKGAKLSAGMIAAHSDQATSQLKMPVCPVAKENCASCHMPKVDLPGAHRAFTDHEVRIVKAGESYPE
jgi:Zn finger protein HypA/HybF involved in hydrogenase expression